MFKVKSDPIASLIALAAVVLCLLVGFFFSADSKAEEAEQLEESAEISVIFGGWSAHHVEGEFNESHNMIGACYDEWCAGVYVNSYNEQSVLAYYEHTWAEYERFEITTKLAIMGGYEGHLDYEVGGFSPNITIGGNVRLIDELYLEVGIAPFVSTANFKYRF